LGGFDQPLGRIDSDNSSARPDQVVEIGMGRSIAASGFQNRTARLNTEISQHPLPRVPECRERRHDVKDVTDETDWLRRQFVQSAEKIRSPLFRALTRL
jgi:hypothetical protein